MSLKKVKAFGQDFNILIERKNEEMELKIIDVDSKKILKEERLQEGESVTIQFNSSK